MSLQNPAPIEVVHVIPNDFTVNQMANVLASVGLSTLVTPLVIRALLRNFGVDMPYWKAVRTFYALRILAHATLPGGYTFPAGKGKRLSEKFKTAKSPTLDEIIAARRQQWREEQD